MKYFNDTSNPDGQPISSDNPILVCSIHNVLPVVNIGKPDGVTEDTDDMIVPANSENEGEYTAIELKAKLMIDDMSVPYVMVLLLPRGEDINTYLLADAIREE